MIVCSCNVLSDKQVATVLQGGAHPLRISQVYAGLGCKAQCGQCAPTIKRIRDDVLAAHLSTRPQPIRARLQTSVLASSDRMGCVGVTTREGLRAA